MDNEVNRALGTTIILILILIIIIIIILIAHDV